MRSAEEKTKHRIYKKYWQRQLESKKHGKTFDIGIAAIQEFENQGFDAKLIIVKTKNTVFLSHPRVDKDLLYFWVVESGGKIYDPFLTREVDKEDYPKVLSTTPNNLLMEEYNSTTNEPKS